MQARLLEIAAAFSNESHELGSETKKLGVSEGADGQFAGILYHSKAKVSGCPIWFSGLQPSSLSFTRLQANGRSPLLLVGDDTLYTLSAAWSIKKQSTNVGSGGGGG